MPSGMLWNANILTKMFLDRRPHRGPRDFRFRPRMRSRERMEFIRIEARQAAFEADVCIRTETSDMMAFDQIFLAGAYDMRRLARYAEIAAFAQALPRPLILDIGANVGFASLYFNWAWPRAKIVAVEPDVGNVRMARKNAAAAEILHAAIASENCRADIVDQSAGKWMYRTHIVRDGPIAGISIRQIMSDNSDCQPFLCKIDIEGAESELFSRNTEWFSRFPVVVVELHDWLFPCKGTARNFLKAAAALDRDFVLLGENIWSIARDLSAGEAAR